MKITIISFLVCVSIFHSAKIVAQTQQGTFRLGGNASFAKAAFTDNNSYTSFSADPSVAYFIVKQFSIGVALPITNYSGKSGGAYSARSIAFGPEVRYYFPFGKWAFFPEASYSFGKTSSETSGFGFNDPQVYKTESKFSTFRIGAGLTYFITPNVGIEGILFYRNNEQEIWNPFEVVAYEKSINFSIGFQFYLNRN